jgi:hypothetical protein
MEIIWGRFVEKNGGQKARATVPLIWIWELDGFKWFQMTSQMEVDDIMHRFVLAYLEVAVGDLGVVEVQRVQLPGQVEGEFDDDVRYLYAVGHPAGVGHPALQPE